MDKEVVVHTHNGTLFSHKRKAFESVLMRWMNLEPIIQSEVVLWPPVQRDDSLEKTLMLGKIEGRRRRG